MKDTRIKGSMILPPAQLEHWMRDYYFATQIDIGSSGVENFSLAEIREITGLALEDLDEIVFHDSWTLGAPELRDVIARRWTSGDRERVMVTHGSSEAIFLIMHGLLEPDDEVVVFDPCYQQLFAIAEAIGCQIKKWPLQFENQYVPDFDRADEFITPRTRMIIANFPHNPTGVSLKPAQQQQLIDMAAKVGAYLVWDGAFAELTYDQAPLPDPCLMYERAISMGTLSKAYGLPGLRVGWCLAPPDVLEQFAHLRDYTTLHLSPLVEHVAQYAIKKGESLVQRRRRQGHANLGILAQWVDAHQGLVEWVRPRGGVCAFPRFPKVQNTETLCQCIAERYGVLLVPGSCFQQPQHVRLGFGGAAEEMKQGLSRLSSLLHENDYI